MSAATPPRREPLHRRTGSPVRRDSRPVGAELVGFWRKVTGSTCWRILAAAERFDELAKAKGRRNGRLGYVGLRVLKELVRLVDWKTGRLEPSLETIAARCRFAKSAVVAALARLREHGFVTWLRRFEPTGRDGARGPQVRQVTNAYRMELPAAAASLVRAPPPLPDDFDHAREARAATRREAAATDTSTPLGRSLTRLALAVSNASPPGGLNPTGD